MSIDLLLTPVRPIRIATLLPRIASVLVDLLALTASPNLTLTQVKNGIEGPVVTDELGTDDPPCLLIAISGEHEAVALTSGSDFASVSAAGRRTNLQFALMAAVAIVLAREFSAEVWDDGKFFGDHTPTTPEALLQRIRVQGPNDDYHEAASRITWGPSGGAN